MSGPDYDAVVVGAGPNGLAAAITLARAGCRVLVREANATVGGAARSMEGPLPGFVHDPFSAIHPLGAGSPFFRKLPLHEHGLHWVHPPTPLAHPYDDGTAALLERSVDATGATLGNDAGAWRDLFAAFAERWDALAREALAPLHLPRDPLLLAGFGVHAIRSARGLAEHAFRGDPARALFGGNAAHAGLPLGWKATSAFGLMLTIAGHAVGWPFPRGGAGRITQALASYLRSLGGEIEAGRPVRSLDELPSARAVLLNLTPRQILRVAGDRLPAGYRRTLRRYRYGAGVFKVDWSLDGPIPWRAPGCERAGTLHLVGGFDELLRSEHASMHGRHARRPFVLLAQPSRFDRSRAPEGGHTAWGYCHVPNGSTRDMTERIEAQVERFAPGFRKRILHRRVLAPSDLQRLDANLVGGDVNGGAPLLGQLFFRPALRLDPYTTPVPGLYVCSASTPPGGGVHGMCGHHAALSALRRM